MSSRFAAACLLAWLLLTPTASAQTPADAVAGRLGRVVRECPQVTIFDDIDARVDGSSVLLTGKVTASSKKEEIERRVAKIEGVSEVRNEIAVLPPLSSDDELRHGVAEQSTATRPSGPTPRCRTPRMYIIVERGHVVLRGTVNSNVERTMARTLASGLGERSLINELRTEGRWGESAGGLQTPTLPRSPLPDQILAGSSTRSSRQCDRRRHERAREEAERPVKDGLALHADLDGHGPALEAIGEVLFPGEDVAAAERGRFVLVEVARVVLEDAAREMQHGRRRSRCRPSRRS